MKKMKLIVLAVIAVLAGFCLGPDLARADLTISVRLTWDPATNADGYILAWGEETGVYTQQTSTAETETVVELPIDGSTIFFAVLAYNTYGQSAWSQPVAYTTPSLMEWFSVQISTPDDSGTVLEDENTIQAAVPAGAAQGAYAWWFEDVQNLSDLQFVMAGQVVRMTIDIRISGQAGPAAVIFRLENDAGKAVSPERMMVAGEGFKRFEVELAINSDNDSIDLACYFGSTGDHTHVIQDIEVLDPAVAPVYDGYLRNLSPSAQGSLYAANFNLANPLGESDFIEVGVALSQEQAESGDFVYETTLLANELDYIAVPVEIMSSVAVYGGADTMNGIFIRAVNVVDGQYSAPFFTAYLAGNNSGTADDRILLWSEVAVDLTDRMFAQYGYYYYYQPQYQVGPYGDFPASQAERTDMDNNNLAGRYTDYSLTYQLFNRRLRMWI